MKHKYRERKVLWTDRPFMDIAIIRSNPIIFDPRVTKVAKSLGKRYDLIVLGWNRAGTPGICDSHGFPVELYRKKAPFGKSSLLFYLPLFWIWIFMRLCRLKPDIVHACDLDTLIPAYLFKIFYRKKIVFDIFDRYAMSKIPTRYRLIYFIIEQLEEMLMSRCDSVISVSEKLLGTFRKSPKKYAIVMNCPEDHKFNAEPTPKKSKELSLVYTGAIIKNRGLELILQVIEKVESIKFIVAGPVIDEELFERLTSTKKVFYKGLLKPYKALELQAECDVIMILYDLARPINRYSMPNKLFESMLLGKVLISNVATEIITEENCGIVVDYDDLNALTDSVIRLRDDAQLRVILGSNGRKAFESKYNWNEMEKELFGLYENLR